MTVYDNHHHTTILPNSVWYQKGSTTCRTKLGLHSFLTFGRQCRNQNFHYNCLLFDIPFDASSCFANLLFQSFFIFFFLDNIHTNENYFTSHPCSMSR